MVINPRDSNRVGFKTIVACTMVTVAFGAIAFRGCFNKKEPLVEPPRPPAIVSTEKPKTSHEPKKSSSESDMSKSSKNSALQNDWCYYGDSSRFIPCPADVGPGFFEENKVNKVLPGGLKIVSTDASISNHTITNVDEAITAVGSFQVTNTSKYPITIYSITFDECDGLVNKTAIGVTLKPGCTDIVTFTTEKHVSTKGDPGISNILFGKATITYAIIGDKTPGSMSSSVNCTFPIVSLPKKNAKNQTEI